MKWAFGIVLAGVVLAGGSFFIFVPKDVAIGPQAGSNAATSTLPTLPEAPALTSTLPAAAPAGDSGSVAGANYHDIGLQEPLPNPPSIVKGLYLTGWSAGSASKMRSIINLVKKTELNAVVIDIKDYSGYVSYAMDLPEVKASGAESEIRIARPNALVKELHDNGIYVIGRITSFQDPILAKAHPEWALGNKMTGKVWTDNKGLAWMDPAAKPVWEYLASIAKDGFNRGFDEIQFDYVRFASDGSLGNISYPSWDEKTPMARVIEGYFKFLRSQFPDKKISADLFGLATVNNDDLGIGQVIESAFEYFDYVSPMVYPSHYAAGFLGYKRPAKHPYEVIAYSMERALAKLKAMGNSNATVSSTTTSTAPAAPRSRFNLGYVPRSKLRPWLQDFEINGVPYTAAMVREEKQAVYDVLNTATSSEQYAGWMLWNASNNYTAGALDPK